MSINSNEIVGSTIDNAIFIDALDNMAGVNEMHSYIDQLCSTLDAGVKSVKQTLICEKGKQYDKFIIRLNDEAEKVLYFDISSFFGMNRF